MVASMTTKTLTVNGIEQILALIPTRRHNTLADPKPKPAGGIYDGLGLAMACTALYCTVLYCTGLHCTVLHHATGGGIYDGRGLAMALALGADAVWVGTRFVASVEG